MKEAPAVTRAVAEQDGKHLAEVSVFLLDGDGETRLRGPSRQTRQAALKDCLEMRKVAVKCVGDSSLFQLRQLIKDLRDTTWTVKDLGGRLLEGAEGPPAGYALPRLMSAEAELKKAAADSQATSRPAAATATKYRGLVRGKVVSPECIVEVADVHSAELGGADRAEMVLRRCFSRFGPVMEVHLETGEDEFGEPVASVRFASAKGAQTAMMKAKLGFLPLSAAGESGIVRLRQPSAQEHLVWRKFPKARAAEALLEAEGAPSKKKLRPNERFACKGAADAEAADASERFWEAQHHLRGVPAEPPPPAPAAEVPPKAPEPPPSASSALPEKPLPTTLAAEAGEEDVGVRKGEEKVDAEMAAILEKPFSQQRRALKALRRQWHPDKNPERLTVATRVFQFIQKHDEWLAHHGLT